MKRIINEELILFTSVVKWIILAIFIGILVGLSTTIFLKTLDWATKTTSGYRYYYLLLPLAFFLSTVMVRYFAPDAEGHGTEKVIEAVHKHSGKIRFSVVPVKILATVITIAGGGSAGKEGPSAQIGAGLSSFFSDLFRFDDVDRKKFVICGISAGFASVFGTPVAGAIFGIEVLLIGGMLYNVLLPSIIAGITGYYVASLSGIRYFRYQMVLSSDILALFDNNLLPKVLVAGLFFGICALLFIETMSFFKKVSGKIHLDKSIKALIGGISLILLTFLFSPAYLGLGAETIHSALSTQGVKFAWYAFLAKILFTSVTLSFGGSGGVVTPIFFIGATSGVLFSHLSGADPNLFAAIGLVALLSGAANTPIAAIIMAVELFGLNILVYASIACVISFFITGHRSIYPSQILNMKKSTSIMVESGEEAEHLRVSLQKREKSLIGLCCRILDKIRHDEKKE